MISAAIEQSKARIRDAVKRPGITKTMLAERAGIHVNTLVGLGEDSWSCSIKTLEALDAAVADIERNSSAALS